MNRGPMALFGAIVAVGLGPALWLGAQFGVSDVSPTRPPAIEQVQAPAGGGAGAAPDATARVLDAEGDELSRPAVGPTSTGPSPRVRSIRTQEPTTSPRSNALPTAKPSASTNAPVVVPPTESTPTPTTPADPTPPAPDGAPADVTVAAP